jgi:hypothetical protein
MTNKSARFNRGNFFLDNFSQKALCTSFDIFPLNMNIVIIMSFYHNCVRNIGITFPCADHPSEDDASDPFPRRKAAYHCKV